MMHGEVKTFGDMWLAIEYEPSARGIQITGPAEVLRRIWGLSVVVRLQDGTERAGFANSQGAIKFSSL